MITMTDTSSVEIIYAHHHGDHVPGDRVSVDEGTARKLVKAGRANYATQADAKAAEGEDGAEKTARRRATGDTT